MPRKTDQIIEPINADFTAVAAAMVGKGVAVRSSVTAPESRDEREISFDGGGGDVSLHYEAQEQAIWATVANIADMFDSEPQNIESHLKKIFADGELDVLATTKDFLVVRNEGARAIPSNIKHYNLDAILSVGYRVNAKRAIKFRQWATETLRTYLEQGFVINEKALRESPEKLNRLAAAVRALRSEEKQVYAKVRECFKLCSSDYDPSSQQVKTFYALLQDKFHHAVTELTSSKLIMDRADHLDPNMGLQMIKGDFPTIQEALIGKNYLKPDELYRLHLLSEQFLLYAEATALANRPMTMNSLHEQLDKLLTLNGYPVFDGYQDFIKDEAITHARREHTLFKKRIRIETLGIEYSEEALADGDYDDLLIGDS